MIHDDAREMIALLHPCPRCDGKGTVEMSCYNSPYSASSRETWWCHHCKGRGSMLLVQRDGVGKLGRVRP